MNEQESIVYVVDDDPSIRTALGRLMESVNQGCKTFSSAQEFLNSHHPDAPSCIILDVRMPGLSGLDLQHKMAKLNIQVPIIFLTGYGDIPMAVRAVKAGAMEFLTKPFHEQVLLDMIRQAIDKSCTVREQQAESIRLKQRFLSLTPREREVMEMVVTGMLNKQIATELGTSERTVKVHRAQVMQKMQAGSLATLVHMAEQLNISSLKFQQSYITKVPVERVRKVSSK